MQTKTTKKIRAIKLKYHPYTKHPVKIQVSDPDFPEVLLPKNYSDVSTSEGKCKVIIFHYHQLDDFDKQKFSGFYKANPIRVEPFLQLSRGINKQSDADDIDTK